MSEKEKIAFMEGVDYTLRTENRKDFDPMGDAMLALGIDMVFDQSERGYHFETVDELSFQMLEDFFSKGDSVRK